MNGKILVDTNILAELLEGNSRIASYISELEICISGINEMEPLSKSRHHNCQYGKVLFCSSLNNG